MKKEDFIFILSFLAGGLTSAIIMFFISYTIFANDGGISVENKQYWKGWEEGYWTAAKKGTAVTWDELEGKE